MGKLRCRFSVKILLAKGPSTEMATTSAPRDLRPDNESLSVHISVVQTGDSAAGKKARIKFFPLNSSRLRLCISTSGSLKLGAFCPTVGTETEDAAGMK